MGASTCWITRWPRRSTYEPMPMLRAVEYPSVKICHREGRPTEGRRTAHARQVCHSGGCHDGGVAAGTTARESGATQRLLTQKWRGCTTAKQATKRATAADAETPWWGVRGPSKTLRVWSAPRYPNMARPTLIWHAPP
eukprot:6841844-Prymnesium_polylepis.1